ncbi:MAG: hypothetical protein DWQ11_16460 [Proteobacteria bacterium]|nr:MAG: hypothetical protein DWQ11_16460 [Pseudomonadota bacterium]
MPDDIVRFLAQITPDERRAIFKTLRHEFPIHELETRLNTSAEVILEAISRASDLTLRGIRGIIAEAAFKQEVVLTFTSNGASWKEIPLVGDHSFDFALKDPRGQITIQVKMQRQKEQRPMLASEANKKMFRHLDDHFVVETQRTRGGKNADGTDTRPYRFGEFDLLAVAMHPSTNNWSDFLYTVERWLVPTPGANQLVFKYQPVPKAPNNLWTDNLETAIDWLRSDMQRRLPSSALSSEE